MRVRALIHRIFLQLIRDKRTMALLFIAPLFVLTLMFYIFNGDAVVPHLGTVGVDSEMIEKLSENDIEVIPYDLADEDTILEDKLDGLLMADGTSYQLILENGDPGTAQSLRMKIVQVTATKMLSGIAGQLGIEPAKSEISTDYVYGSEDTNVFDTINPIMIGFYVFFFVFLIAGIGLLREKTTGTLERLMSTPIRRHEVVFGYLLGYGVFALVQTLAIVLFSVHVLDIIMIGSIWNVILINAMAALVALSLGILLSSFATSEFQMMQFIPIVIIPQVFFSGIFPIEGMAAWMQVLGKCMPLYYTAHALKNVMYKGYSLEEIVPDLLILFAFAVVFILLNMFALKKYRRL
jgi:ABC-2 type transport system permease protein